MSPEEIAAKRKELIKFYKDELPLLKSRSEYEEYLTKIEEARFQRFQIRVAHTQMVAPQEGSNQENPQEAEARMKQEFHKSQVDNARKLKVDV
jgi:hypothetical protein